MAALQPVRNAAVLRMFRKMHSFGLLERRNSCGYISVIIAHQRLFMKKKQITHTLILVLAALIWGFAFVSQSVGAEYVDAFTFLAVRSWLAVVFLIPVIRTLDIIREKRGIPTGKPMNRTQRIVYLTGGLLCGTALFLASAAQQIGIAGTTTAKAGFITALYVVLVPVLSVFLGHAPSRRVWVSVLISIVGLYFLCFGGGVEGLSSGDLMMLLCALLFSVQILLVGRFIQFTDGVRLSQVEMLMEAVIATVCVFLFGHPTAENLRAALPALLYAGIMSSGVAYTLQIVGQEDLDPSIASLAMCLESVFSALGGWMLLHQKLSGRELFGCVLMFFAIVLCQLPGFKRGQGGSEEGA